jgi:thymidine kinase
MKSGTLTVYAGPMMAGKTTSLIAELEMCLEDQRKALVIKPAIDNRYDAKDIVSHDGTSLRASTGQDVKLLSVDQTLEPDDLIGVDLLLIDEAQFFVNLADEIEGYLALGIDVVAVGLDMDSEGRPFGCMPRLLAMANTVYKLTGICTVCGEESTRTFRKLSAPSEDQVLIGGAETYEPRCLEHWIQGQNEKIKFLS